MNKLKTIFSAKKIAIFLMVAISALVLVACGTTNKVPYGSLGDEAYISIPNQADQNNPYKVTEKQLYDQLRTSSVGRLYNYIDEQVFADVVINKNELTDFEVKAFEQEINTALFSSATITPEQLNDYPDSMLAQRILSFADSFVITNPGVDINNLINFLDEVVSDALARYTADVDANTFDKDATFIFGYLNKVLYDDANQITIINKLIEQYLLPVQKKVYAKEQLGSEVGEGKEGDINDEESSAYISEAHAVTYYNNNIAGRYDTSALVIKFQSVLEYEIALRKHAIKSNARGEWFNIPNIADQDVIDDIFDNQTDPYFKKAYDILVDDLKQDPNNLETVDYRDTEFATYYSKFVLNKTTDAAYMLTDAPGDNKVLDVFLTIYDELHGTTYATDLASNAKSMDDLIEAFTMEYTDPRFTANAELRSTIYKMDSDVLYDGGEGVNDDGEAYAKPYSRQVQSIGGSNYLLFLFSDNRDDDKDVLDDSDSESIVFMGNDNAQEIKEKAFAKLIEQRLTAAYINTKSIEKHEDVKINIYDPIIRELYKNQFEYTGSEGFKDSTTLLEVDGTPLSVDDFYAYIEPTLGLSTALDIVFINKLRDTYEITKDQEEDFRKQFETQYVNPFLANQYESAGFPASMGIDKFLLVGFGAWAQDDKSATKDAIDKVFIQQELRRLFQEDLTIHFADNALDNNIYTKFAELANTLQTNEVAIEASHLLFEIDIDNDGVADNPNDLDQVERDAYEVLIKELIVEVNKRAKLASNMTTGFQNVVTAYNGATRYELTTVTFPGVGATEEEIQDYINGFNRDDVWGKFKKAGIRLLYQDLGTISNETNFPNSQAALDADFYEYTINLANFIKDEVTAVIDDVIPSSEEMVQRANALLPLVAPTDIESDVTIDSDGLAAVRTAFGWHLVVAKSYVHQLSAALKAETDADKAEYTSKIENPYVDGTQAVGYNNDGTQITWEQIFIFIEESKEETGVVTLTNSVQSTISKYFGPLFVGESSKYQSTYAQLEIAFQFIFDGDIKLPEKPELEARLTVLRDANFNQFFNYAYFEDVNGEGTTVYDRAYNESFAASYGDFFNILDPK